MVDGLFIEWLSMDGLWFLGVFDKKLWLRICFDLCGIVVEFFLEIVGFIFDIDEDLVVLLLGEFFWLVLFFFWGVLVLLLVVFFVGVDWWIGMVFEDWGVVVLGDGFGDFVEFFVVEVCFYVLLFVVLVMGFEVIFGVVVFMMKNVVNCSFWGIEWNEENIVWELYID